MYCYVLLSDLNTALQKICDIRFCCFANFKYDTLTNMANGCSMTSSYVRILLELSMICCITTLLATYIVQHGYCGISSMYAYDNVL